MDVSMIRHALENNTLYVNELEIFRAHEELCVNRENQENIEKR